MHTMVTDGTSKLRPGMELVVTKWIALKGTVEIVAQKEALLLQKFPAALLRAAKSFVSCLDTETERKAAEEFGEMECFPLGEGGILAALWQMADAAGVGLSADLRKIPIRQETIEICEVFDINPYGLCSEGSLLIGTFQGYALAEKLNRMGIPAVVIGRTDDGAERVLYNQEIKRYIDKPAQDEIYKVGGMKE